MGFMRLRFQGSTCQPTSGATKLHGRALSGLTAAPEGPV